jgi:hypothetical protein
MPLELGTPSSLLMALLKKRNVMSLTDKFNNSSLTAGDKESLLGSWEDEIYLTSSIHNPFVGLTKVLDASPPLSSDTALSEYSGPDRVRLFR